MSPITYGTLALMMVAAANAGDSDAWRGRSVYQVLTDRYAYTGASNGACGDLSNYCGGTFKGMEENLDYISGMGFDAIWISPPIDNLDPGYHGYWGRDWYGINSHFGSADDLKSLVSSAHDKGIWVMVDVVGNHVAPIGNDFGQINPFNSADHYHSDCDITDWNDQGNVEYCRLADLPDLNQDGNDWVRQELKNWVKDLVDTYGFDGLRIDTIPEVSMSFWSEFGPASGVFQMGECFNGDPAYVGPYQSVVTGLFNYPMYYTISDVFGSGMNMGNLQNRYTAEESHFSDMSLLGLFVDNHDNARFLCNHNGNQQGLRAATVFSLTGLGIPFVYYGTEQYYSGCNDPQNRESLWQDMNTSSDLYQIIAKVNAQRQHSEIWNQEWEQRYAATNFYAFSRGKFLVALTNTGNDQHYQVDYSPFDEGETVCNIFYPTTDCQTVSGGVDVSLSGGESKIYVPQSMLASAVLNDVNQILQ